MTRSAMRRALVATLTSLTLVALSAAQVLANGGNPPFPR